MGWRPSVWIGVVCACTALPNVACHVVAGYQSSASADLDGGTTLDATLDGRGSDQGTVGDQGSDVGPSGDQGSDVGPSGDSTVPPAGLVSHFPFDGDAKDVITGNSGNPTKAVRYSSAVSKRGQSAYFDGAGGYIALPFALSAEVTADFTVAFWVLSTQDPAPDGASFGTNDCDDRPLWIYGNGIVDAELCGSSPADWGIALMQDGFLGVSSACSSTSVTGGSWRLVVFTREKDPGSVAIYVDGDESLEHDFFAGITFVDTLQIGVGNNPCNGASGIRWFEGYIDELRFWKRVLTLEEIRGLD